jgi:hypothetical protein
VAIPGRVWVGSFLSASLFSIGGAWGSEPIRFEYSAPDGCPDQAQFVERVRARTQRGKFAESGELARTFNVVVTTDEAASTAKVEFVDSNGERVVRAVSGETCDEVVSGIALVAALAIDARAGAEESAESAPPPQPKPPAPGPATPADSGTAKPAEPARARRRPRWEVGMSGAANTWSAPDVAFGLGAFGEVDFGGALVRLSALRVTSSAFVGDRSARFTSTSARLSGCPVALELAEHLALVPCLSVDLGALEGEGIPSDSLANAGSDVIFWPVGVPSVELRYDLDDFLVFEARGELGFPLRRRTFAFDDRRGDPVFEVPVAGAGAGVSVGLRFP